jgi:hypothetical protein
MYCYKTGKYISPKPETIKKGLKIFLEIYDDIKQNEDKWFNKFGDEYLVKHIHDKWLKSKKCALMLYNRLDSSNRYIMIKYKTHDINIAEAISVTSLGITSYMNKSYFHDVYGKEKGDRLWKYVSLLVNDSKEGGICEMLKQSTDDEIDKIINLIEKEVTRFS